jgi:predicted RNA-binding Zn-ribbon protein involved in translation (DUF1610 family)
VTAAYKALQAALEHEHPECHNNTCIICAAMRAKLYLWAAYTFINSIDDPESKVPEAFKAVAPQPSAEKKVDKEANKFCAVSTFTCPECELDVYLNQQVFGQAPQEKCGNCGYRLNLPKSEEDDAMTAPDWDTLVTNAIVEDVINQHEKDKR